MSIMKRILLYFILSFSSLKYQGVDGSDMIGELRMQMNDLQTELNLLSRKFHEEKSKANFLSKQLVNKEKNIQNLEDRLSVLETQISYEAKHKNLGRQHLGNEVLYVNFVLF